MKDKRLIVLIITLLMIVIAIGLLIWGNIIMRNYDGYLEIVKAARSEAKPQFIIGLVLLGVAYVLTYVKKK